MNSTSRTGWEELSQMIEGNAVRTLSWHDMGTAFLYSAWFSSSLRGILNEQITEQRGVPPFQDLQTQIQE